jgi:hypothetical protein
MFDWMGDVRYENEGSWHWRHHTLVIHKGKKNYKRGRALLKRVLRLVRNSATEDWKTYRFRCGYIKVDWGKAIEFRINAVTTEIADCDDMECVSYKIWELIEAELLKCTVEIRRTGDYLGETYYAFFRKGISPKTLEQLKDPNYWNSQEG